MRQPAPVNPAGRLYQNMERSVDASAPQHQYLRQRQRERRGMPPLSPLHAQCGSMAQLQQGRVPGCVRSRAAIGQARASLASLVLSPAPGSQLKSDVVE